MDIPAAPSAHQALHDNIAFWRAQSRQLERDRSRLQYILPIGPVAGLLLYLASHHLFASFGVAALALMTWGLGLYMTSVRREEYAFALGAAEAELAAAVAETQPR